MENILEKIVANKRIEVLEQRQKYSIDNLLQKITDSDNNVSFKESLSKSSTGIISEFKRRSPSKGWIFEKAEIKDIIPQYAAGGAAAISILTDFLFFGGTFEDFKDAKKLTTVPLLRKDFVIDEYQLYQAKVLGAGAVLLIASCLSPKEVKLYAAKAKGLGLDVLLEIHNEKELNHINEYVDVVGINNRNLSSFVTDVNISFELGDKIPSEFLKISESGISHPQTVLELRQAGFRGFLMGENFMKTNDPGKALFNFIEEVKSLTEPKVFGNEL